MKCLKITVSGMVQGVGYRYFCYKKALEYKITGYAKNLFNGNVEVIAQGNEKLLNGFVKELNTGPHYSAVKSLKIEESDIEIEYREFSIY